MAIGLTPEAAKLQGLARHEDGGIRRERGLRRRARAGLVVRRGRGALRGELVGHGEGGQGGGRLAASTVGGGSTATAPPHAPIREAAVPHEARTLPARRGRHVVHPGACALEAGRRGPRGEDARLRRHAPRLRLAKPCTSICPELRAGKLTGCLLPSCVVRRRRFLLLLLLRLVHPLVQEVELHDAVQQLVAWRVAARLHAHEEVAGGL
mmetsp:Transcript_71096/g.230050  ORF Transcript_71096/g.230050 Transcript_71096/m.230050 type:complete len:209 (-) Transcript_71096:474-1100(-)